MSEERDRYAKLVSGVLEFAPKNKDNICNYDLDVDQMIADGYKIFVPAVIDPTREYVNFRYIETPTQIVELCDLVPEPTPEEQAQAREEEFNRSFFLTSLGYDKRIATKSDGSKADFLLDYLALISKAVDKGLQYPIITYDKPTDFSKDDIDWEALQHFVFADEQFVLECLTQVGNDFKPTNN